MSESTYINDNVKPLLKRGIEDRDWRKIEEAANLLGVNFFRAEDMACNKRMPKYEIKEVIMAFNWIYKYKEGETFDQAFSKVLSQIEANKNAAPEISAR